MIGRACAACREKDERIEALDQALALKVGEIKTLEAEVDALNEAAEAHAATIAALNQALAAKDATVEVLREQVTFLRGQNGDFAGKLVEIASPGALARQQWTPPARREGKDERRTTSHNPGRLAQLRRDLAAPRTPDEKPTPARVVNHNVEATFQANNG